MTRRCPEVLPEDATDLIKRLLRRDPASRLGAGQLAPHADSRTADNDASGEDSNDAGTHVDGGFEALRAHPFFRGQEFCGGDQVHFCD